MAETETKKNNGDNKTRLKAKTGRQSDQEAALEKAQNVKTGDDGMPKHDQDDLLALKGRKGGAPEAAPVETDPPEAEINGADWLDGRDVNDVVEVAGQRETVEARMARNGNASPEKAAGATTLSKG